MLSTAPQNFTVIDPEGVIAPQSCVDIVVRYTNPSASHANTNEKFRITMYDKESLEVYYDYNPSFNPYVLTLYIHLRSSVSF